MGKRVDQRKADVGKAIVFLADRCGMSQAQLAKKAGVSPKAITDWKHGKSSPSPQPLAAVLKALGCTQDVLDQATDLFNWWRIKMQFPVDPTFEIMEAPGSPDSIGPIGPSPRGRHLSPAPSGLPASSAVDEHHREVGRTVERLYHLLSPRPDSKSRR
jgi:transcriptional regulator with XRE-family HTH domain